MKKILLLFIFSVVFVVGVMAVDSPPSFDNEQFYGDVMFGVGQTAPAVVSVKIGSASFSSSITDVKCDTLCNAHYGYGSGNILRVMGSAGDEIIFYVDDVEVKKVTYISGAAIKLDFDVTSAVNTGETPGATPPATAGTPSTPSSECKTDWNCSSWSNCTDNLKTRVCMDLGYCNVTSGKPSVKNSCGNVTGGNFASSSTSSTKSVLCVYDWYCTPWSNCFNGKQTRGCSQVDKCDADLKAGKVTSVLKSPQPSLSKVCVEEEVVSNSEVTAPVLPPKPTLPVSSVKKESCFDSVKNQNEEDVDCGGVCKACASSGNSWIWYLLLSVIVLGIIGVGGYFFWKSRQSKEMNVDTTLELRSAYDRGMQRGISQDDVTQKLVERGWDRNTLEGFLRKGR